MKNALRLCLLVTPLVACIGQVGGSRPLAPGSGGDTPAIVIDPPAGSGGAPGAGGGTGGASIDPTLGTGGAIGDPTPGTGGAIDDVPIDPTPGTGGAAVDVPIDPMPGTGGAVVDPTSGTGGAAVDPTPGTGGAPMSDPFHAPATCTSGQTWTGGGGSSLMNPGLACIDCHSRSNGPRFTVAGTLYPTAHEPDRCDGFGSGGAQVVIVGADGLTTTLTPNSAGNFYTTAAIAFPFHAKVVYQGRERAMGATQATGDCNRCHTQSGSMSAPGRILLP